MAKAKYRIEGEDATGAAFRSVLGNAKSTADRMATVFKVAFAGISAAAITDAFGKALSTGDNLEKFRQKARLSAEAASSLAYAAKLSDVELDGLGASLQKMQIFLSKAASGTKENVETLGALGLEVQQIRDLKADEQFELIAEQVAHLASEEDQARAVTDIFGKSGGNLLPMFQQGARGIREARMEAEKLGQVFSEQQLKGLADADQAVKRLDASWQHFQTTLFAAASNGGVTDYLNKLSGVVPLEQQMREAQFAVDHPNFWESDETRSANKRKLEDLQAQYDLKGNLRPDLGGRGRPSATSSLPPGFGDVRATGRGGSSDTESTNRALRDQQEFSKYLEENRRENERLQEAVRNTDEEIAEGLQRSMEDLGAELEDVAIEVDDNFSAAIGSIGDDLAQALFRGEDGFRDMLKSWAADWLASDIRKLLDSMFRPAGGSNPWDENPSTGGGSFGGWGSIFGFANGGRPPVDRPSIVGERGPELFIPDTAGTVLPNLGGGVITVAPVISIDARGATRAAVDQLPKVAKQISLQVEQTIVEKLRRRAYRLD